MSLPAPLSHAFPKLVAQIDAERPLISSTLLDILVTEIRDTAIVAQVTEQHAYDILTRPSQASYLDHALSAHFGRPGCTFILIPPAPPADLLTFPETTGNAPPATTNGSPQRNALKFNDRTRLSDWMKLPENKEYVARQTDTDAAVKATSDLNQDPTQPLLNITTANITGMRNTLGISKFKPEKPAETPTVDLIALQKQLDAYGQQVQRQAIAADTIHDVLNLLIAHVRQCEAILKLLARGEVGTELSMAGLSELPPLTTFPETKTAE